MSLAASDWFDEEGLFSPEEREERSALRQQRREWRYRRMLYFSEIGEWFVEA